MEMAPIGTIDAFEEQNTSERSLTRKVVLKIEVGPELSSKQEGGKQETFRGEKPDNRGKDENISDGDSCHC
jgi:hypothetical protein